MSNCSIGRLFVIAGPSGAGKTTLAHHLVESSDRARFSVSATTREPRHGETDGTDYFFMSEEDFLRLRDQGWFLESARVHGSMYGTPGIWVRERLAAGDDVVLDIDVQGALQVRSSFPGAVLVFVLPPSPEVLRRRLEGRGTDSFDVIQARMEEAARETRWIGIFDHFIRNDSLERAMADVNAIACSRGTSLAEIPFPEEARELDPAVYAGRDYWTGRKVLVTAGPTREMIDDVRFISNRSSGLMGYSLAMAFRDAGAAVTLISGPCGALPPPPMVTFLPVESAEDLSSAVKASISGNDLLAMVAAVSDFRPGSQLEGKLDRSSGGLSITLEPTLDIIGSVSGSATGPKLLAYALEYGNDAESRARKKMVEKGTDAIFMNRGDVQGMGMESPGNSGMLLYPDGTATEIPPGSKRFVAEATVAALGRRFGDTGARDAQE